MTKLFFCTFIIFITLWHQASAAESVYHPIHTLSVSAAGVRLIERFEGFRESIYQCSGGKPTIGYGHVVKDYEKDKFLKGITKEDAHALLIEDLNSIYVPGLKRQITVTVTQYQFDALASFIYNLGEANLKQSTLLSLLNAGQYKQASPQFPRWCHADKVYMRGLFKRRIAEMYIFQNDCALSEELKTIKRLDKETLYELYVAMGADLQNEARDIYLQYHKE